MNPIKKHKNGYVVQITYSTYLNKDFKEKKKIKSAKIFKTRQKAEFALMMWVKS